MSNIPARAGMTDAQGGTATQLRVLTFNIHHGENPAGDIDLQTIADIIVATDADLVALQEVDKNTTRSGNIDEAAQLAQLTGMHAAFGKAMDYDGGQFGNAVLSRRPIDASITFSLPHTNIEPRSALSVLIHLADGQAIVFTGTHLGHRDSEANRVDQAAAINANVPVWAQSQGGGDTPMILAGDMNDTPGSDVLDELAEVWTDPDAANALTYPSDTPTEKIDYILLHPASRFNVIDHQVIQSVTLDGGEVLDTSTVSDHRPVLLTVDVVPEPASMAVLGVGAAGLVWRRGRRR